MQDLAQELEEFRRAVPLLSRTVYLANCSQGPLSEPVRAALLSFVDGWDQLAGHWDEWLVEVEAARLSFAQLVGADPGEVAVGASVSQLVSSVVSALVRYRQASRRRILGSTAEFAGVAHAWLAARAYGWQVEQLPADAVAPLETIDVVAAIDDATGVVSIPWVSHTNGARLELEPIVQTAHDHGALVFVDAYQAAGTTPIDVKALGVDILASGTLTYLMGTAGIAFMYVAPEHRDRLLPTVTGWFGRMDPSALDPTIVDYPETASRFDLGTPPIVNAFAARAGIDLVREAGPDLIGEHLQELSASAYELAPEVGLRILGPNDPRAKGAVTAFDAGSPAAAARGEAELRGRGIVGSAHGRAVRLAPHGFTRADEWERAIRELADVLRH